MERSAWTDARLDDLAQRVDSGFDRVDRDIRELRADIGTLRSEMHGEIGTLRSEMHGEFSALRLTFLRLGGGLLIALVGTVTVQIVAG
jgi:hypothetical protein